MEILNDYRFQNNEEISKMQKGDGDKGRTLENLTRR
jgi:hypothetical protein